MSVIERLDLLRQEQLEAIKREEKERADKSRAAYEKHKAEYPASVALVNEQLGALRKLGVVTVIEELVGDEIRPLDDGTQKPNQLPPLPISLIIPTKDEVRKLLEMPRPRSQYSAQVLQPQLSQENLVWDTSLRIRIAQLGRERFTHRELATANFNPSVYVIYQNPILLIRGEEITFDRSITEKVPDRIELVEDAIARALLKPQRPEVGPKPRLDNLIVGSAV